MASKYLTLDCFTHTVAFLLSVMNLTVFLPFNINSTEVYITYMFNINSNALYITQRQNTAQTSVVWISGYYQQSYWSSMGKPSLSNAQRCHCPNIFVGGGGTGMPHLTFLIFLVFH